MPTHYAELHARSAFSFLRGASQPEEIAQRSSELNLSAVALCDRDGLYGSARLKAAADEAGHPGAIVGAEITLEDGGLLPLLVQNRTGYQNLCRMLTRSRLRSGKEDSSVSWDELTTYAEGLVCLTGDEEGPLRRRQVDPGSEAVLEKLLHAFGRQNVYVELQRHRVRGEDAINQKLLHLAEAHRLPVLATNGVCYARKQQRLLYDAFSCLYHHTTLEKAGSHLSWNAERYLKTPAQMRALFADLPRAIDETLRLAERLEFRLQDLGYQFPRYPAPEGHDQTSFLREQTWRGALQRYGKITPRIRRQLDHELDLISRLGFCGYFLIVWDIVNRAREMNVLVQGRGSAANSAVCYSLGITCCDPIGAGLLFERFLSEGRTSWPDIDLDLPSGDRRESVIQDVYQRFAPYGAAMTANVITYRGRSAMREMGKVLDIGEGVLKRFSDQYVYGDYRHTLELKEQIRSAGMPNEHPRLPALLHLYQSIHGLPRHLGQHSGGMVISDQGLDRIVPLENASMPGRVVLQWDKDDCEDLGIIKVDLLGLGMMAAIQDTVELCQKRGPDREFDLAQIPRDDPATFEMMQKADTVGVFQIESRAQMATLPRMKPRTFYDVVIEVAIIRPGPIVGNLVHPYLNRRNGREPIDYIHPSFKPILERTLGVPLFQEQVLKMAMVIAGFSGTEAEELRRAMSFHRSEARMQKVMAKLRAAMTARRVAESVQEKIISSIQSFALYGFPESHAISFGSLAYASVWMKAHRPVEFYAALLNNQPMGFYSSASLVKDAKRHGIRVRPVHVTDSDLPCTVEDDHTLRLGLNQVKKLHRTTAERLLHERALHPWRDLDDFLLRSRVSKEEKRILARLGALNGLPGASHRRDALWNVEGLHDPGDLFSKPAARQPGDSILPPMSAIERLEADYAATRLTTGPHPMALLRADLPNDIWRAADLEQARHGDHLTIAGMVICRQRPGTAKGHVFISLEDETGISNAFVPAATFEKHRLTLTQEKFLRIQGRVQKVDNVLSIYALEAHALPSTAAITTHSHDFH